MFQWDKHQKAGEHPNTQSHVPERKEYNSGLHTSELIKELASFESSLIQLLC